MVISVERAIAQASEGRGGQTGDVRWSPADELRLYRRIATMDASAPIPSLDDQKPTWSKASALARDWGLNQLADRLAELGRPMS